MGGGLLAALRGRLKRGDGGADSGGACVNGAKSDTDTPHPNVNGKHHDHVDDSHGHGHGGPGSWVSFLGLSFASLGVVFGDLGTSPLYTYASLFQDEFGNQRVPSADEIHGGLACLFWALVLSSTLKYQVFMMSANHQGQGGLFSLLNSLRWGGGLHARPRTWRFFQLLAIAGVALMTADGMLTSSVSVTSAIEGIGLAVPAFNGLANPDAFRTTNVVSAAVLCVIFALQAAGSQSIGLLYAPVMLSWLIFIGAVGAYNLALCPSAVRGWSPAELWRFWHAGAYRGAPAWRALGGVVLCLTGSEALYADMGHFGRGPIAMAWFSAVFPALVLQYTGQSAYLLRNIELLSPDPADPFYEACAAAWTAADACKAPGVSAACCARFTAAQDLTANSFWHALPGRTAYRAMLVIATLASIVGSQSVITGVFTIYSQAAGLGLFPAIEVRHTSTQHSGQVFCPGVNRAMFLCVMLIVGTFQHSSNLTAVFGACVSCAFLCDSTLRLSVAAYVYNWHWASLLVVGAPLLVMDGALASANVAKYFTAGPVLLGGGSANGRTAWIAYIPLIIVVIMASVMITFMWGRRHLLLEAARRTATLLLVGAELEHQRVWGLDASALHLPARGASAALLQDAAARAEKLPDGDPPPPQLVAELLTAAMRKVPSAPKVSQLLPLALDDPLHLPPTIAEEASEGHLGGGSESHTDGNSSPGGGRLSRRSSFYAAHASQVILSVADDTSAHEALGTTLHALERAGALGRAPSVGIYITNTASLLDSEALSETNADIAVQGALELPHAFLHAVQAGASLPRLALIVRFEFTEQPKVSAGERTSVHRIGLPPNATRPDGAAATTLPGVFLITVRCGWAENPGQAAELTSSLYELGRSACAPGSHAHELASLCHMRCWLNGGESGCVCEDPRAPAECLPITFIASRDGLQAPPGAALPVRLGASLFNAVAANTGTFADMLALPADMVAETSLRVVVPQTAAQHERQAERAAEKQAQADADAAAEAAVAAEAAEAAAELNRSESQGRQSQSVVQARADVAVGRLRRRVSVSADS